ncbi:MAG TPA: MFS transporter [bacterium]|nr:MFS transporter [bacterium]HPN42168.1 MFS transporter [bacterium]
MMDSTERKTEPDSEAALYRDRNLQIIFLITLMAVLGVASITPVFPKIARELHISAQSIGLLVTSFTLPGIFLTPALGVLSDRLGRKKILIPSLFLFALGGGACSLARDFEILLLLRFVQGIGAAAIGSLNATLIGDLYSGKKRMIAMGYNASVLSIGTATYPTIGGMIALFGWRYPFLLPLLAIPVGLVVLFALKNPEPENTEDFFPYLRAAWKSMKNLRVLTYFTANLFTFIILYGAFLTFIPIFINERFGASPALIGLVMSAMSLVTAATSSQLGRLIKKFSDRKLLKVSFFLYAAGLLLIPFVHNLWLMVLPIILFGLAHGANIPIIQALIAGEAPMQYRGTFMSLNGMVLRLGQTLGPLLMGAVFVLWGITGIFYAGAILAAGIALFLMLML